MCGKSQYLRVVSGFTPLVLLTLSLLTVISAPLLNAIVNRGLWSKVPTHMLLPIFIALGVVFAVLHKLCATFMPEITGSALFNF